MAQCGAVMAMTRPGIGFEGVTHTNHHAVSWSLLDQRVCICKQGCAVRQVTV